MFLLFETIAVIDFVPHRLEYHQTRMDRSYMHFYKKANPFILKSLFDKKLVLSSCVYKWKIEYNETKTQTSISEYIPRFIKRVKFIEINASFDYSFKFTNRVYFDVLKNENEDFDELIFLKNGYLTDATFANLVLKHKKSGELHTPKSPLLNGTQRQWLIDHQIVKPYPVQIENIDDYSRIFFINAMLQIHPGSYVEVDKNSIEF